MGGSVGTRAVRVVIAGAGIAGRAACEMALGLGAQVTMLDINLKALARVQSQFGHRVNTIFSTPASIARLTATADLLIGAVLVPGAAAPKIITRDIIKQMENGSVFVDISIDQGGCGETSRPTSLENPVFEEEGVLHYGVCNMPAQAPRTSTLALTAATLPYVLRLADQGMQAVKQDAALRGAVNTHEGFLTNKEVSDAVGVDWKPFEQVM